MNQKTRRMSKRVQVANIRRYEKVRESGGCLFDVLERAKGRTVESQYATVKRNLIRMCNWHGEMILDTMTSL